MTFLLCSALSSAFCFAATVSSSSLICACCFLLVSSKASVSLPADCRSWSFSTSRASICSLSFSSSSRPLPPTRFSSSAILSRRSWICLSFGSMFFTGLFSICFARSAKRSVEIVSLMLLSLGPQLANITVFEFPPSESFNSIVRGEPRYGMCLSRFTILSITVARAESDKLMLQPSCMVSPVAPVLLSFSDPARSTMLILLVITIGDVESCSVSNDST
mmetsp:Transcript_19474/g.60476  ORF Transcript_19474/g.60476 Transcript_19474/m.60476 type:complete len:219 (+) Transcript_19474:1085-1741(+)